MSQKRKVVGRLDLIDSLYQKQKSLRQDEVKTGLDVILSTLTKLMVQNERIEIRGFGSFTLRQRPERMGRNPRTGEIKLVAARYTPHFKVSRSLGEAVKDVEPVRADKGVIKLTSPKNDTESLPPESVKQEGLQEEFEF